VKQLEEALSCWPSTGIHLLENLKLDELAAKRIYEFAFIIEPLKIQGATGSTVAPIAIR
jgi:kynurenine formamidase